MRPSRPLGAGASPWRAARPPSRRPAVGGGPLGGEGRGRAKRFGCQGASPASVPRPPFRPEKQSDVGLLAMPARDRCCGTALQAETSGVACSCLVGARSGRRWAPWAFSFRSAVTLLLALDVRPRRHIFLEGRPSGSPWPRVASTGARRLKQAPRPQSHSRALTCSHTK